MNGREFLKKQSITTHNKSSIIKTLVTKLNGCWFSCLYKINMKKIGEKNIIFTASISPIKLYKNFIITSLWNTNDFIVSI